MNLVVLLTMGMCMLCFLIRLQGGWSMVPVWNRGAFPGRNRLFAVSADPDGAARQEGDGVSPDGSLAPVGDRWEPADDLEPGRETGDRSRLDLMIIAKVIFQCLLSGKTGLLMVLNRIVKQQYSLTNTEVSAHTWKYFAAGTTEFVYCATVTLQNKATYLLLVAEKYDERIRSISWKACHSPAFPGLSGGTQTPIPIVFCMQGGDRKNPVQQHNVDASGAEVKDGLPVWVFHYLSLSESDKNSANLFPLQPLRILQLPQVLKRTGKPPLKERVEKLFGKIGASMKRAGKAQNLTSDVAEVICEETIEALCLMSRQAVISAEMDALRADGGTIDDLIDMVKAEFAKVRFYAVRPISSEDARNNIDVAFKMLLAHNDVFADIISILFFGKPGIISPEHLESITTYSQLRVAGHIRWQDRDAVKIILSPSGKRLLVIGLEVQKATDKDNPLRSFVYDAGNYRMEVLINRNRYAVREDYACVTITLYIGNTPWKGQTLHERLAETLDELAALFAEIRDKIADYPNLVFDIQRMSRNSIDLFQSDFWFIVACFLGVPENKIRERIKRMVHVTETLSLMTFITGNSKYMEYLENLNKWLEDKGESKGEENMNGRNLFQCIEDDIKKEIALKMHYKGYPIDEIVDCVGRPEEEVLQWINEIQLASA